VVTPAPGPAPAARTGLQPGSRPNILLIVADDLGYQDLSIFGGEIQTPNIDSLFRSGITLSQFYVAVACQPTRAMLLSGMDHHLAGVGTQGRFVEGTQAYQNRLADNVASIAERLSVLDYRTLMIGKWHLGMDEGQGPADRGCQRSTIVREPDGFRIDAVGYGSPDPGQY